MLMNIKTNLICPLLHIPTRGKEMGRPRKNQTADAVAPAESTASDHNPSELPKKEKGEKRFYSKTLEFDHDIFKLLPATMRKNVGFSPNKPLWEAFEHCHVFHSVDSKGNKKETCTPIGGHFHEVTIEETDGVPKIVAVGPPVVKKQVRDRVTRRVKTVYVPVEGDDHTHEVQYIRSEKVKPAKANVEFAKFTAQRQSIAPGKVEGVLG